MQPLPGLRLVSVSPLRMCESNSSPIALSGNPCNVSSSSPLLYRRRAQSSCRTIPYQHYQAYSSHYPQAAYGHYQYAAPLTAQSMQSQVSRPATSTPVANTATTSGSTAAHVDTADIATLNDALGSAGVDLRVCMTRTVMLLRSPLGLLRRKKNHYSVRTTNTRLTEHLKIVPANNLSNLPLTLFT